jgi:Rrf2 family protein
MLSQSVGYAITALGYLAGTGDKPVLVRDIAEAMDIPPPYLAKIINTLARKGFVMTQRGIGGGVALAHRPESVSLYDICVALDEPLVQRRCMLGMVECSDERACPAHQFWSLHRQQHIDFLKQTTLLDMADFVARQQRHLEMLQAAL